MRGGSRRAAQRTWPRLVDAWRAGVGMFVFLATHPPSVDAGAVAEKRPDDGDYAFLSCEVEWRSALAILVM